MANILQNTGIKHANTHSMDTTMKEGTPPWLEGKRVLMTGATGGIGKALVEELLPQKPSVLIVGHSAKRLEPFNQHKNIDTLEADLSTPEQLLRIPQWITEHWGSLDVLIHNAASSISPKPIDQLNHKEIMETMIVGPIAGLELIRIVSPLMPKGSRIVLTSSAAGFSVFPDTAGYCSAKWAMEGLSKATAVDLWSRGITVNTVVPPATKTELSRPHFDSQVFQHFPDPHDVLEPFLYLLSESSERISGQSIFYEGPMDQVDRNIPALKPLHCQQPPMRPPTRKKLQELGVAPPIAKVDIGEAPFPPSEHVIESVSDWMNGEHTEEYPDASCQKLRHALATHHQIHPDQIIVGSGSSEVLSWLLDELVVPGEEIICAYPCFSLMRWMATFRGLKIVNVENTTSEHNLIEILSKINPTTKLVYLDSPSNPIGDVINEQGFAWFLNRLPPHVWIIVDHAYQDFIHSSNGYNTTTSKALEDPRILSVRTLSKSHALAAWRIGYLSAHPQTILRLLSGVTPFTVSSASQIAALSALQDKEHTDHIRTFYIQERARIFQSLNDLEIPHWKGETSFFSVYWPDVETYHERAAKQGIALSKTEYQSLFVAAIRDRKTNDRVLSFLKEHYPLKAVQESLLTTTSTV